VPLYAFVMDKIQKWHITCTLGRKTSNWLRPMILKTIVPRPALCKCTRKCAPVIYKILLAVAISRLITEILQTDFSLTT
jgi:hypothetical protein